MNKLESPFKNKENQGSVCIKYKSDGRVERVKQGVAYTVVEKQNIAAYCSKTEWKKFRGQTKQKEVVIAEDIKTNKPTKDRIKGAKNIRAANKKKK